MDREQWRRIRPLFLSALDHEGTARNAFLTKVCGSDEELREQLESLLAADGHAAGFLENPAPALTRSLSGVRPTQAGQLPTAPTWIGPYEVLRELGRGAASRVYLASRADDQYRKRVAIKVVYGDLANAELVRRFRRERQILAALEHPNIARFLDGGTSDEGLPYFVMEYVDGLPVDEYCDRHGSSIDERLRLFRRICSAVQSAHQNLVIHRDVKPSNVLVTPEGVAKLLDFGVAKLLAPELFAERPDATVAWLRLLTPSYASPEQVQGSHVGTASDVYSLGVVLYQLLSGHLPHRVAGRELAEIARVLERSPVRPSRIVTEAAVSRARASRPDRLRRRLQGDLDNIVLKALRREPSRRYATVEQFSEDVRRHLESLPVLASHGNFLYRARRFQRRHRAVVAAAAVLFVMLAGFVSVLLLQSVRLARERDVARQEREASRQIAEFLVELFEAADPQRPRRETVDAREVFDRGAERILHELGDQPRIQASLLRVVGQVYTHLGLYERARPVLEKSLELRRAAADESGVAESLDDLGTVMSYEGLFQEAEAAHREALEIRHRRLGPEHPDVADSLTGLAHALEGSGDYDAAAALLGEALAMRRKLLGSTHPEVAQSLNNLAVVMETKGESRNAERLYREALAIWRTSPGQDHHLDEATALHNLSSILADQGELEPAEQMLREVLGKRRQHLGNEHPQVAATSHNLGALLIKKGRLQEAEALLDETLRIRRQHFGSHHVALAKTRGLLAWLYSERGDYEAAEPLLRENVERMRSTLPATHPGLAYPLVALGGLLLAKGEPSAAEALLREGVEIHRRHLPADDKDRLRAETRLAACLNELGRNPPGQPAVRPKRSGPE